MKHPNIATAIRMYYEKTELTTSDIKELFSCGGATAKKLKNQAADAMAVDKVRTWLPNTVDTRYAYKAWGIDINDYEDRLKSINRIKKLGVEVML